MNRTLVGTSRCDVPARAVAGGTVAPLYAARTAQRAIPTSSWPRFTSGFWRCSLPMKARWFPLHQGWISRRGLSLGALAVVLLGFPRSGGGACEPLVITIGEAT